MFPADLVELAERINGTDLNGDGVPDWSVCHVLTYYCQAPHILLDIVTNVLQYEGPKQGCLFGAWLILLTSLFGHSHRKRLKLT
jgi:hypothetical protein